jgi:hypothetical protein
MVLFQQTKDRAKASQDRAKAAPDQAKSANQGYSGEEKRFCSKRSARATTGAETKESPNTCCHYP